MTIYTFNVNGIRAAVRKGFLNWLQSAMPDLVCLQEIKATIEQLPLDELKRLGYYVYVNSADKKGYSGVAVLSLMPAERIEVSLGHQTLDSEGRVIVLEYSDFTLCNAYFPSGTTPERQALKMTFLPAFERMTTLLNRSKPLVVTGDFNICHLDIDIHDPKRNANTPGFLPEERRWLDGFIANSFVDGVRKYHQEPNFYSWWSYRSMARDRNKGWRIDYVLVDERISDCVINSGHDFDVHHSDHCPVWVSVNIQPPKVIK